MTSKANSKSRPQPKGARRRHTEYATIGDLLAAQHLRRHGSYPNWYKGANIRRTA